MCLINSLETNYIKQVLVTKSKLVINTNESENKITLPLAYNNNTAASLYCNQRTKLYINITT